MPTDQRPQVALVHDYLTQRGGAERVVLELAKTFPDASVHTSLYEPDTTFPEFRRLDIRPMSLNRIGVLRSHHRLGLPLFAPAFSRLHLDADVMLCSSSGWAHGASTTGAKIVYCHAPARWLYQQDRYLGNHGRSFGKVALGGLKGPLRAWDRRAAASATKYVVNSSATATMVRDAYGIVAEIVPPPPAVDASGPMTPVEGLEPGFLLVVARLLPYKNVDLSLHAARATGQRLVVIGDGPERHRLESIGQGVATFLGTVDDATLRWCYDNCSAHIAMSHEDYGLSPLEAAAFGRPTVALRGGGYLDTVVDGVTGLHVNQPTVDSLMERLTDPRLLELNPDVILEHSRVFGAKRFRATMAEIVASVSS